MKTLLEYRNKTISLLNNQEFDHKLNSISSMMERNPGSSECILELCSLKEEVENMLSIRHTEKMFGLHLRLCTLITNSIGIQTRNN